MEILKEEEEIVMDLATISCNKDREGCVFFWGGVGGESENGFVI